MWEGRKYTTAKTTDNYRDKLSAVPEAETCGWLKDNFGVSWQIGPTMLGQIMCTLPNRNVLSRLFYL